MVASDPRLDQLRAWLAGLATPRGLQISTLTPVSADASARRYFRLSVDAPHAAPARAGSAGAPASTVIAVDAPPPEKCREFVQIAGLLAEAGVHVPNVLAYDFEHGFMLESDLGGTAYIDVLDPARPAQALPLMRDALRALVQWQRASKPGVLPAFDDAFLQREMNLFPEWYLERHLGHDAARLAQDRATLAPIFRLLADSALAQPQIYMLRDFMPRNLMVGEPNPGVIDFQDAVEGPITYDVASLLRDAFISWDEEFELDCFVWYWEQAKKAGLPVREDFGEFYRELEWMGLQRHLKILGLFARLTYRDHKPRYLADIPRFIAYARKVAVRYRPLAPLARLLDEIEGTSAQVGYTF
ncbi:aminoglycoside phosphotransferase family protein [Pararobbsia silviterrae]|uniref:Aminoglycoside phosphotransferase n=1 Tax=Pararobbsia silviterrae TaxID=1792498 RepID=A0A494YB11_9BURK|nr:phosphotransferase [Pararobbsia silviterrae]RKP58940.1 aminoglycoside phosphotransferase [Pararobbsia silviterrae]